LLQPGYLVHAAQVGTPCGAVVIKTQAAGRSSFALNLANLPAGAKELLFGVSLGEETGTLQQNAGDITSGFLSLSEAALPSDGSQQLARYAFRARDFDGEKALLLGKLYHKTVWRLAIMSSGFRAGLAALLPNYGVPEDALKSKQATPRGATPTLGEARSSSSGSGVLLPANWPGNVSPQLPQGLTTGVGILLVEYPDGKQATGTGFVINPGGYLLTCHHVVNQAKTIKICLGGTNFGRPVRYIAGDEQHDLALLWMTDGNGSPYWLPLLPPAEEPQLGEALGLLGYPLGFDLGLSVTYSQGIINSYRTRNNVPFLQIDAGAAPGSSGGPVFRRSDGRVVGMLQGGVEQHGMLINLALDIRTFWRFGWHG
jgi:S1-C subfamily serine protease